jgi:hypothetical protein
MGSDKGITAGTQTLATKLQLATKIRTLGCRAALAAASHRGSALTEGCALTLIGKPGTSICHLLFSDYVKENGDDAALAPLLEREKSRVLVRYDHLDEKERASVKISLEAITVVEPSTESSATSEVEERIRVLEALQETTTLPQLQGLSSTKWKKRLLALSTSAKADAEIGGPVDDGVKFNQNLRESRTEPWCKAAERSIDVVLKKLRARRSPPTAEALKQMKRDAWRDAFENLVRAVEAHEDKAIQALPAEAAALEKALKARFGPRAEAAAQRHSDMTSKGGSASQRNAREQGVQHPGLKAAEKKKARCTFGPCTKPKGDTRAPNNNYPQYVFKRIEHGIAKATKITSWMKYEEPEST